MYAKHTPIPTASQVDATGDSGADPQTLCANWKRGCNGETDGPRDGLLTLCDDCAKLEGR